MDIKRYETMLDNANHSHGIRRGEIVWVGGQTGQQPQASTNAQPDFPAQITNAVNHVASVLSEAKTDLQDLVFLLCFYVEDGTRSENTVLDLLAKSLPDGVKTAINLVPVQSLVHQGQLVELEGYAMRRVNGDYMPRSYAVSATDRAQSDKFCAGIRCGKMIFVSGQSPMDKDGCVHAPKDIIAQTIFEMREIGNTLTQFGAGFGDVVKSNRWYSGRARVEDFEPAALACAQFYSDPGPAATGIPVPRFSNPDVVIKLSCVAMLGERGQHLSRQHVWPVGHWDWTIDLPYKHGVRCEDVIFLGGQVSLNDKGQAIDAGNLADQVQRSMGHIETLLHAFGTDHSDLCKLTTLYRRANNADAKLSVPSDHFQNTSRPGPANTQIPFPDLAYPGLEVEIEAFAVVTQDNARTGHV